VYFQKKFLKSYSNTKYCSDALTREKLFQFSQSTQASCNLLRNGLKTSRLLFFLIWWFVVGAL